MRKRKVIYRPVETIVQQTNCVNTKQLMRDLNAGKVLDMNPGSLSRSYDFPDGSANFDQPRFEGFESLIDQHVNSDKISEHLHPTPPSDSAPTPPSDPAPTPPAE